MGEAIQDQDLVAPIEEACLVFLNNCKNDVVEVGNHTFYQVTSF